MASTKVPIELSSTPGIVDNSNATAITIDSSENVGIGTSSPEGITSGVTSLSISDVGSKTTGDKTGVLAFKTNDSSYTVTYPDGVTGEIYSIAESVTGAAYGLGFVTGTISGSNRAERLRIDNSGNVGIGVTAPQTPLQIAGGTDNANVQDYITLSRTGYPTANFRQVIASSSGSAAAQCSIVFKTSDGTNAPATAVTIDGNKAMSIVGALSKGSGSFRIDHPLESKKDTHQLVHSFIEGPQADLIYRGKVDLVDGSATVNIDTVAGMTEGTFVALNREVQCFTSNESDWDAVKGSVLGNILTIECQNTSSTATVSWLVIGERQDQHMIDTQWTDDNGKVIVEPLKTNEE